MCLFTLFILCEDPLVEDFCVTVKFVLTGVDCSFFRSILYPNACFRATLRSMVTEHSVKWIAIKQWFLNWPMYGDIPHVIKFSMTANIVIRALHCIYMFLPI